MCNNQTAKEEWRIERCAERMKRCAEKTESERRARGEKKKTFWNEELKEIRKELRNQKKINMRGPERKAAAKELKDAIKRRVKEKEAEVADAWANGLQTKNGDGWKMLRKGIIKGGGKVGRDAVVIKSGAPYDEEREVPRNRSRLSGAKEAADEVGRYGARLYAQDWSIEDLQFNDDFKKAFIAFWEWKGVTEDRKLQRDTFLKEENDKGNPGPKMCQDKIEETEWLAAKNKLKRGKAVGEDKIANEHIMMLDTLCAKEVIRACDEAYEKEGEPESWKTDVLVLLDKASTKDKEDPWEKRGVKLRSCMAKMMKSAYSARAKLLIKAELDDTQSQKTDEGCERNVLILTQKIGERMEQGKKTYVMFCDLRKAFDTVDRKLLWAKMRKMGVHGKLLQKMKACYKGKKVAGKVSGVIGRKIDDNIQGVAQGDVDSSDLFTVIAHGLDEEIEKTAKGTWAGIPMNRTERLHAMLHADDTTLIAENEEGLKVLAKAFEEWCRKWRIVPNAGKCKVVVFERTGNTKTEVKIAGSKVDDSAEEKYLGYILQKKGSWGPHIDNRLKKAAKWDGIATHLVGRNGGCTTKVASDVRSKAAEAGILYGAELWAQKGSKESTKVHTHQAKIGKEILGVRSSAEAAGVLTELGWGDMEWAAVEKRLTLWWKIGKSNSRLLKEVEQDAEEMLKIEEEHQKRVTESEYNWWRTTKRQVKWLKQKAGKSEMTIRSMNRKDFQQMLSTEITLAEQSERLKKMKESSRLAEYATWLESYSLKNGGLRKRWGAPTYLKFVGEKAQVRIMAMARLGLLPVEEEEGRWKKIPKEERLCHDCKKAVGSVKHFLSGCKEDSEEEKDLRLWRNVMIGWVNYNKEESLAIGKGWREIAKQVSRAWGNKLQRDKGINDDGRKGEEEKNEEEQIEKGDSLEWGTCEAFCNEEPTNTEMEKCDVEAFTDGSGANTRMIAAKAGYGVWIMQKPHIEDEESSITEIKGPVVTQEGEENYRGADKATNNTGELTGIIKFYV